MSARSRSKSPARKTRAHPVSPAASPATTKSVPIQATASPLGPEVQLGLAVAVIVSVWSQCNGGEFSLSGFATRCGDGFIFDVPTLPFVGPLIHMVTGTSMNFVLTLHVLNTISSNRHGKGYWLNNFASCLVATFVGEIAPAVLAGSGNTINLIFTDHVGMSLFRFFMIWYVLNYDIPACPVEFDVWGKFSNLGGDALKILLGFGSAMFTSALVGRAVNGAHAEFSQEWFQAIVAGVIVGTAGSFFPLSKGFSLQKSVAASNALAASFFIASNGFAHLDFVIHSVLGFLSAVTFGVSDVIKYDQAFGAAINNFVTGYFGSVSNFVITVVAVNYLFGSMIPMDLKKGFDAFGLMDKLLALFQLA